MNRRKLLLKLNKITVFFEILISILLLIGIIVSIPDIIKYYIQVIRSDVKLSANLFRDFLSHVLMLVIAMEFVLLMVAHTDNTIIHLLMLVISRKMLIVSENMPDLLIGVIAITILFLTRKYLAMGSATAELLITGNDKLFSASAPIRELNDRYNYKIDAKGTESLGGLISKLLEIEDKPLELGVMVDDGVYIYEIQKVQNGVIEEISIHNIN